MQLEAKTVGMQIRGGRIMDKINGQLSLYSTLTYVCLALAIAFFAAAIFFFFHFHIIRIIQQHFGIHKKLDANGRRNAPSTSELSRSRRVAKMEYSAATGELPRKRSGVSGAISKAPPAGEVIAETTPLYSANRFRIVKEEYIIHTDEKI